MENRRQHYRHNIARAHRLSVRLRTTDGAEAFTGEIVNLSIGGLCVISEQAKIAPDKRWIASFALGLDAPPLNLRVDPIHAKEGTPGHWGFRFIPSTGGRSWDEEERMIWRYLLEEQRRERRERRSASGVASAPRGD